MRQHFSKLGIDNNAGERDFSTVYQALHSLHVVHNTLRSESENQVIVGLIKDLSNVVQTKLLDGHLYEDESVDVFDSGSAMYSELLEVAEFLYDEGLCINSMLRVFSGDDIDKESAIFREQLKSFINTAYSGTSASCGVKCGL